MLGAIEGNDLVRDVLGLGGQIGPGSQWMSWIHIDDLIALFRLALASPEVTGFVNAVSPRPVTNAEFTTRLSQALHMPAFIDVPGFVLRLLFGEQAQLLLTSTRVVPNRAAHMRFGFRYPELGEALGDLLGHH